MRTKMTGIFIFVSGTMLILWPFYFAHNIVFIEYLKLPLTFLQWLRNISIFQNRDTGISYSLLIIPSFNCVQTECNNIICVSFAPNLVFDTQ